VTCRHHCCEMMASWALEGVMESILAADGDGPWFRENVEFMVIPMVDKDGVEDGDQGKNRAPHDHNRDYLKESIYPEVAAMRRLVPEWSQGRLRLVIDLHCPARAGGRDTPGSNHQLVFVGNPSQQQWEQLQELGRVLERAQSGPLVYRVRHNLPYGMAWNTEKEPSMFQRWAGSLPGMRLATTLEIPYADAGGLPVTIESARALGRDLARAIRGYLEKWAD